MTDPVLLAERAIKINEAIDALVAADEFDPYARMQVLQDIEEHMIDAMQSVGEKMERASK